MSESNIKMVKCNANMSKSSASECKIHMTVKKSGSICRPSNEESGVKELLSKLRSVLPSANDQLSTLDVMQHAIYYIQDLNDILAKDKPTLSDEEKENHHHSFCQSDLYSVNEVYSNEKQQHFNANCQNGFQATPVF